MGIMMMKKHHEELQRRMDEVLANRRKMEEEMEKIKNQEDEKTRKAEQETEDKALRLMKDGFDQIVLGQNLAVTRVPGSGKFGKPRQDPVDKPYEDELDKAMAMGDVMTGGKDQWGFHEDLAPLREAMAKDKADKARAKARA